MWAGILFALFIISTFCLWSKMLPVYPSNFTWSFESLYDDDPPVLALSKLVFASAKVLLLWRSFGSAIFLETLFWLKGGFPFVSGDFYDSLDLIIIYCSGLSGWTCGGFFYCCFSTSSDLMLTTLKEFEPIFSLNSFSPLWANTYWKRVIGSVSSSASAFLFK